MYGFVYQGPSREDERGCRGGRPRFKTMISWMPGVGVSTDVKDYVTDSSSLTFATFPDFREISTNLGFLQLVLYLQAGLSGKHTTVI